MIHFETAKRVDEKVFPRHTLLISVEDLYDPYNNPTTLNRIIHNLS